MLFILLPLSFLLSLNNLRKVPESCSSMSKYFCVYFLRIRIFSYITTINLLKSGNLTLIYYLIFIQSLNFISCPNNVPYGSSFLFLAKNGELNPGSHAAFSCQVSVISFKLEWLPSILSWIFVNITV